MKEILYLALGIISGTLSGLFGIGGGTILIPGLVFLAGLTQHEAQGTTLAIMLLPIGLFAVIKYYQHGHVYFYIATFIIIGFFIGGYIGAIFAEAINQVVLRRAFGIFLMAVAAYTIFAK